MTAHLDRCQKETQGAGMVHKAVEADFGEERQVQLG
jgi:hypothetical protein